MYSSASTTCPPENDWQLYDGGWQSSSISVTCFTSPKPPPPPPPSPPYPCDEYFSYTVCECYVAAIGSTTFAINSDYFVGEFEVGSGQCSYDCTPDTCSAHFGFDFGIGNRPRAAVCANTGGSPGTYIHPTRCSPRRRRRRRRHRRHCLHRRCHHHHRCGSESLRKTAHVLPRGMETFRRVLTALPLSITSIRWMETATRMTWRPWTTHLDLTDATPNAFMVAIVAISANTSTSETTTAPTTSTLTGATMKQSSALEHNLPRCRHGCHPLRHPLRHRPPPTS